MVVFTTEQVTRTSACHNIIVNLFSDLHFHKPAEIYWLSRLTSLVCGAAERSLCNGTVSVRLSVCPIRLLQQRAAGLLLWARPVGDSDRLLHRRHPAAARRSTQ